jgi:catalase
MRTDGNRGGTPPYWPNSKGAWTDQPQLNKPPLEIDGAAAHWDHRIYDDHYQQPGDLFRKMNAAQRQALFNNTARQVDGASKEIQWRHVDNCRESRSRIWGGRRRCARRARGRRVTVKLLKGRMNKIASEAKGRSAGDGGRARPGRRR